MLNERVYILTTNKEEHETFIGEVTNFFNNIEINSNKNEFINIIDKKKLSGLNKSLLILFVESPYLKAVSKHLDENINPLNYILISFSPENNPSISDYNNVFEFINTRIIDFDYKFIFNKLSAEISNKNRISLLQSEVKELYGIGKSLSSEKDTMKLFEMIINSSISLTSSDAGTLYLVVDKNSGKWSSIKDSAYQDKLLKFVIAKNMSMDIKLETSISPVTKESISGYTFMTGDSLRIEDVYNIDPNLDYKHNQSYDQQSGFKTKSMLSIPMKDHENNITGVIQLINKKKINDEKLNYANEATLKRIIPYDYTDELIMNSLAGQAAVALENSTLYDGMQELLQNYKQQNDQLVFLSRKILKAHEEERRRIAREIHDGPAQSTANLSLKLEICKKFYQKGLYDSALNEINDLKKDINSTIKEIRTIIYDLKPSYLEDGLISALRSRLDLFSESTGIDVLANIEGDDKKVEYYLSSTIYRIVQEELANIFKHAKAKNVNVDFRISDSDISLAITDDGKGFDTSELKQKKHRKFDSGFGLEGIKERVKLVNGDILIKSENGKGTTIKISIPLF